MPGLDPQQQRMPKLGPRPRVPAPAAPPQDRQRERAERRRRHNAAKEAEKEASVPTWGDDLLRALAYAVFVQVLFGVTILLVRWRLLTSRSGDVIDDTQLWAAIVLVVSPLSWVFLQVKRARPDNGFRQAGLLSLLLAGIAGAALFQAIAVFVWQLLIGPDLIAGSVLDAVDAGPLAFVTMLSLIVCVHAVFVVVIVPMVTCRTVGLLVGLLPFLGLVVGGLFAVMWSIGLEPTWPLALVWAAAAAISVALVAVVAVIAVHARRDDPSVLGAADAEGGGPRGSGVPRSAAGGGYWSGAGDPDDRGGATGEREPQ